MAVTRIIAIRHAKVTTSGLCYGRSVVPLDTSAGDAAQRMIAGADSSDIDIIWSSPAPRCAKPARLWAASLEVPHRIDERLWELAYGRWDGLPWDAIPRQEIDHWGEDWIHRSPPNGESALDIEQRVARWVKEVPAGCHGLAAHAGVIRALHVVLNGLTWPEAMRCQAPHLEPVYFSW